MNLQGWIARQRRRRRLAVDTGETLLHLSRAFEETLILYAQGLHKHIAEKARFGGGGRRGKNREEKERGEAGRRCGAFIRMMPLQEQEESLGAGRACHGDSHQHVGIFFRHHGAVAEHHLQDDRPFPRTACLSPVPPAPALAPAPSSRPLAPAPAASLPYPLPSRSPSLD
eukprot:761665-Hanusia_phi.AAC.8